MIRRLEPPTEALTLFSETVTLASRRLPAQDADDFAQFAQLWLLERRYNVFDQFAGRSSLTTYLTLVVRRLLIDWQNAHYGRWRPSAAAKRLGDVAVMLERLVYRDSCPATEAFERVRHAHGLSWEESRTILERLPPRSRRMRLSDDVLANVAAPAAQDVLERAEQQREEHRRRCAVAASLRQLSFEDRWLLRARYQEGQTVRSIALTLNMDARQLYRRYGRIVERLRHSTGAPS